MLTDAAYLKITLDDPAIIFFYHDQPIVFLACQEDKRFLVFLAEDNELGNRYLAVEFNDSTYEALNANQITVREFILHPENVVHNIAVKFPQNDEPRLVKAEVIEDVSLIPDEDLPAEGASWYNPKHDRP